MKKPLAILLLTLISLLTGCGQSGPLYLPGTKPPIKVVTPKPQPKTIEQPEQQKTGPVDAYSPSP